MKLLFVLYLSIHIVIVIVIVVFLGIALAICYYNKLQKQANIDNLVGYFESRINELLCEDDVGFAIVVGMTAAGGAELDTTNMERAFSKHKNGLGFAVLKEIDLSRVKLRALIKSAAKFPYKSKVPSLKVICFYFAGHGGGDINTNQPFIEASDKNTLQVQEIVKQFYPIHTPNMPVDIKRLFFFDMCLGTNDDSGVTMRASGISTRNLPAIDAVPAQGNCLVAFATSFNYTSGGDKREGGFWTRFLHQNITRNQDIFEMLADTWEETVEFTNKLARELGTPEIQGPTQTACMGHFNLKGKLPKLLVLLIHLFMYTIELKKDQAQAVQQQGTSMCTYTCTCMSISIICVTCTMESH